MKLYNLLLNIIFAIKWFIVKPKFSEQYINGRKLTFEEDFNNSVIDLTKWNTQFEWETHERIKVDSSNIVIKDSIAHFLVKKEVGEISGWWGTSHYSYTRPHLDTSKKFSQMYGRWECKAKVKSLKGLFPAFWTLTDTHLVNGIGSIKPEIDVFEHFNNNNGKHKQIGCSLHYGITYDKPDSKRTSTYLRWVDFSDKWVVYAAEWTKDSIKWYINGQLVKVFKIKSMLDYEKPTTPMYLIVNESVHTDTPVNFEYHLPDGMEVDWIRVYA